MFFDFLDNEDFLNSIEKYPQFHEVLKHPKSLFPKGFSLKEIHERCSFLGKQGTEKWLSERRIGGSTVGGVLKKNKYSSPYKEAKRILYGSDFKGNKFTNWGKIMEHIAQLYLEKTQNIKIYEFGSVPGLMDKYRPITTYSPDGVYEKNGEKILIEIKCPFQRQVDGSISDAYYEQLQLGLRTLSFCKRAEFYDFVIRVCDPEDFNWSANYHKRSKDVTLSPIALGIIKTSEKLEINEFEYDYSKHLKKIKIPNLGFEKSCDKLIELYDHIERYELEKIIYHKLQHFEHFYPLKALMIIKKKLNLKPLIPSKIANCNGFHSNEWKNANITNLKKLIYPTELCFRPDDYEKYFENIVKNCTGFICFKILKVEKINIMREDYNKRENIIREFSKKIESLKPIKNNINFKNYRKDFK